MIKRITTIFLFTVFLGTILILQSIPAEDYLSSGITVFPSRLYIDMPDGYPDEEIQHYIKVYNREPSAFYAIAKIYNPWDTEIMVEGYSFIPDLSWITIVPDQLLVPANDSQKFYVIIDIPKDKKPIHYNQSWEVWVKTSRIGDPEFGSNAMTGSVVTRLLITTPLKKAGFQISQNMVIITGTFLIALGVAISLYIKKKKRDNYKANAVLFYGKDKKSNSNQKNKYDPET
ncbi:MAG: hypothetical protein KKC68_07810 [Candidatus Thermoplasmatota archaeon]|nr:hypothetical protein [Candidatus Thermoplasmatota archaeon]MBU1941663.1 hypothetical protein [Candidatus Thermoplasmatota archaeon]